VRHLNPINSQRTLITCDRSCWAQGSSVTVARGDTDPPRSGDFSGSHTQRTGAAQEGVSGRLCCLSE